MRINLSWKSVIGLVVYRTSDSSLFYKEFKNTLGILARYNEEVLILGDFNFHLEQSDNTDAQTFLNILKSHGFDSSTNQPTHDQGGWLDVIASRKSVNINYIDSGISDHKLLLCSCEMLKLPPIYWQLQIRHWNFSDTEKFISGLKQFPLSAATSLDVDSALDFYNSTFSGILDKMIPFKTVRLHKRPSDSWFDRECRTSKGLKRSLGRIYLKTKNEYDSAAWLGQMKLYKRLCEDKRRDYWNKKFSDLKIKRLTFGAALIVSLVGERDLLLTVFSLLIPKLFCWWKLYSIFTFCVISFILDLRFINFPVFIFYIHQSLFIQLRIISFSRLTRSLRFVFIVLFFLYLLSWVVCNTSVPAAS